MIDITKAENEFILYSQKFELKNEKIKMKQLHSIRVMKICEKIAKEINLNKEEINLAKLIGLLHDIGRFKQYEKYKTYIDRESFDHGDYGEIMLKKDNHIEKFIEDKKYIEILLKAIKNHNKYKIQEGLKEEELKYAKLIRDADKIDILYEATDIFWSNIEEKNQMENSTISEETEKQFFQEVNIKSRGSNETKADNLVKIISFIYDINYKASLKIIKEEKYIDKIIDRFEFKDKETKEKMIKVRIKAKEYIEKSIKDDKNWAKNY